MNRMLRGGTGNPKSSLRAAMLAKANLRETAIEGIVMNTTGAGVLGFRKAPTITPPPTFTNKENKYPVNPARAILLFRQSIWLFAPCPTG